MFIEKSVCEDERGMMWKQIISEEFGSFILWRSFTNKGYGRGGEVHPVPQFNVVISGTAKFYMMMSDGEEIIKVLNMGDTIRIPKGIPHLMIAQTNTFIIEWHDGELPPFEQKVIYEPYRKLCWKENKVDV